MNKNSLRWLLAAGLLTSMASGLWFYALLDVPFGFWFNIGTGLFLVSVLFALLILTVLCFQTRRWWAKAAGFFPALLGLLIAVLVIILLWDYRIFYFQGLPPVPDKAQWAEDVQYLAGQMQEKYPGYSSRVPMERHQQLVREIESRLPGLTETQTVMELFRLIALPNDAHSLPTIYLPAYRLHDYPIRIYGFPEGWFVIEAGREFRHLIGYRLIQVGTGEIGELFRRFPAYLAVENDSSRLDRFPYLATCAEWLQAQGIIQDIHEARFTLEKPDGKRLSLLLPPVPLLPKLIWCELRKVDNHLLPVFTNRRRNWYWFELMPGTQTLYVQFTRVEDQSGQETIAAFAERLAAVADTHSFQRLVLDLRDNMGGDDSLLVPLLDTLRNNPAINQPGKLFVLIGRHTFSSGVLFANQLRLQTCAILAGEPTGQGPVFCANPTPVVLPHSRLPFILSSTSTDRSSATWPFALRNEITPDLPSVLTHADFLQGRDTVLETVMKYQPPASAVVEPPAGVLDRYCGRYMLSPVQALDIEKQGASLVCRIDDFMPHSLFKVQTILTPISENSFLATIPGVKVSFPAQADGPAASLALNWMGEEKSLPRASDGQQLAMEEFARGRITEGLALLQANLAVHRSFIPMLEGALNDSGYDLLNKNQSREAVQVFRRVVELYPNSSNAYDSLGEALLKSGDRAGAIYNYRKSVELDPTNENGRKILEGLGVKMQN